MRTKKPPTPKVRESHSGYKTSGQKTSGMHHSFEKSIGETNPRKSKKDISGEII